MAQQFGAAPAAYTSVVSPAPAYAPAVVPAPAVASYSAAPAPLHPAYAAPYAAPMVPVEPAQYAPTYANNVAVNDVFTPTYMAPTLTAAGTVTQPVLTKRPVQYGDDFPDGDWAPWFWNPKKKSYPTKRVLNVRRV
eukprot:TRINITY_DN5701_c0_g1_i1.p2 TRINITY_DN5701_c0_g1~~TRINITY_DN5701_c0_g1_i1.p2  ORF type:complete len:136 (-),score=27.05 TRINITY_DN5701_c0_g1_i1:62-469(-)